MDESLPCARGLRRQRTDAVPDRPIGVGASYARWRLDFAQFVTDVRNGHGRQADIPFAPVRVLMRRMGVVAVVGLAMASSAGHAQSIDGARAGVNAPMAIDSMSSNERSPVAGARSLAPFAAQLRLRKYAPLASAIVPGSGQAILGNDRFVGYLAVEALAWWMYAKDISERTARERQFKELAREVARAHYSTTFPDADWAYYEWMRD